MREKWRVHRGWIKAHIAVDVKTRETLAVEITNETVADREEFENLIDQIEQNIQGRKIESGIKTRVNASTKSRGSPYRAKCVRVSQETKDLFNTA